MARDRKIGGVSTHRVERSLASMTVSARLAEKARQSADKQVQGDETEQQFKFTLVGQAVETPVWQDFTVTFRDPFYPALERRDSQFTEPAHTWGYVVNTGGPVFLTSFVKQWNKSGDGSCLGAVMTAGAYVPGALTPVKFSAELHLVFQGWAAPYLDDDEG